jgi:hypothetical protein
MEKSSLLYEIDFIKKYNGEHKLNNSNKLILIFGWMGSQHKNISKYSQIYEEEEFNIIQFTPNFNITNQDFYINMIKNIFNSLDLKNKNIKYELFIHVFSNHGLKYYITILKLLQNNEYKYLNNIIKGVN